MGVVYAKEITVSNSTRLKQLIGLGLEREAIILFWWRRGLALCLVHGADRWLLRHLERGLSIRLERGLSIRLGRLLVTGVKLSITEELERFDDNVSGVPFLAILVIP